MCTKMSSCSYRGLSSGQFSNLGIAMLRSMRDVLLGVMSYAEAGMSVGHCWSSWQSSVFDVVGSAIVGRRFTLGPLDETNIAD